MDAKLMEEIFSSDQGLNSLPSYSTYVAPETDYQVQEILGHMSLISPVEADMVELHLLKGVSQALLGKIFGYTQPNVHYRINRGIERLKIYLQISLYTEEELRKRLKGFFTDQKDIDVLVYLYLYSSQSHVARMLGDTQGKVRYRFLKCMQSLSQAPNLEDVYLSMKIVGDNLTLLRTDPDSFVQKKVII
jgi:hypothetical protein